MYGTVAQYHGCSLRWHDNLFKAATKTRQLYAVALHLRSRGKREPQRGSPSPPVKRPLRIDKLEDVCSAVSFLLSIELSITTPPRQVEADKKAQDGGAEAPATWSA